MNSFDAIRQVFENGWPMPGFEEALAQAKATYPIDSPALTQAVFGHATSLSLLARVVVWAGTIPTNHAFMDEEEAIEILKALQRAGADPSQRLHSPRSSNDYSLPELLMVTLPHRIEGFDASGIMAWLVDNGADPSSAMARTYGTPARSMETFLEEMIQPGLLDYLKGLANRRLPQP